VVQTKLLTYASALEAAALGGVILGATDTQAFVAFALLHGAAAMVAAPALVALLAKGAARARLALAPLAFSLLFALPVVGIGVVVVWLLTLRRLRSQHRAGGFGEVSVPPFDIHLQGRPRFRFSGAAGMLANPRVPVPTRVGALLALSAVPGRIATPLLRSVLGSSDEDVRLLAYGLLDAREKRLNQSIHEAMRRYGEGGAERVMAAQQLAELYWELVYQGLAVGDVRSHALKRCLSYAEEALAAGPNPEMALYRARALHALGRIDEAEAAYASLSGLPESRVLPYLAELAFDRGDYGRLRALLKQIDARTALSRLSSVLRYWEAA
jgi:tetratricopeptide (TPR) repeat protein